MDKDLDLKAKTVKLLEENREANLHALGFGGGFFKMIPKAGDKIKIDKPNLIKNFCASKDIIKRIKRQPIEWNKIFINSISDKGSISGLFIYLFIWPRHATCRILVPQSGTETVPPAMKAQSPNRWTAKEYPGLYFFKFPEPNHKKITELI